MGEAGGGKAGPGGRRQPVSNHVPPRHPRASGPQPLQPTPLGAHPLPGPASLLSWCQPVLLRPRPCPQQPPAPSKPCSFLPPNPAGRGLFWTMECFVFCFLNKLSGFFFFGLHSWHMEVPRPGVKSEPQLPAYTTATTTQDPSHVCDLHHSLWQHQILNPLSKARD